MKKILSLILVVTMLFAVSIPAYAVDANYEEEINERDNMLFTSESEMPRLSPFEIQSTGYLPSTMHVQSRISWINETKVILENAYSQEVKSINETTDFIVFSFKPPIHTIENVGYIDRVEYVKPESALASTYDTKLTYMYGWLGGYYSLETQSGEWGTVKDLLISVAGLSNKLTVYSFAISVLGIAANYFSGPEIVNAQNTAQYYVLNKIGQVRDPSTGLWGQYAYVGSRRAFYRTILEEEGSYGHYTTLGFKETVPNSESNPTNGDKIELKSHFNDDNWIINKAVYIYQYGTHAYMDVYGMTVYFSDTYPN